MVPPKVLVIDDDWAIREAIKDTLRHEGYELLFAEDGGEAMALVEAHRPNAIILDLRMPGIDGLEFLAKVSHLLPNRCSVVVLTAYGDPEILEACRRAGVSSFLEKPFHLHELREVMRSAVTAKLAPHSNDRTGWGISKLEPDKRDGTVIQSPDQRN